jgi:G protein-coupled receptor 157
LWHVITSEVPRSGKVGECPSPPSTAIINLADNFMAYATCEVRKSLVSSLECLDNVVILRWKDIRTGSRAIITYLSIADFFTAFGYIIGSLNYSINYASTHQQGCVIFTYFCQIQSFITSSSSLSSFFWTSSLAIYLYLSIVHNKVALVKKLFPFFHVVNWLVPIVICFPLLVTGYLGYSYLGVSTWCFIDDTHFKFSSEGVLLVMVAGKFWEIVSYVVVIVLYFLIKRHISQQVC